MTTDRPMINKAEEHYRKLNDVYYAVQRQGYQTQAQYDEGTRLVAEAPFNAWAWDKVTLPHYPIKEAS